MAGYTRKDPQKVDRMRVAIRDVDLVNQRAKGVTRIQSMLDINISYPVGGMHVNPADGEQWYVIRFEGEWRLESKIPFNDPTLLIEDKPGQVKVGSGSGPLELSATEINSHGNLNINGNMKLGDSVFRANPDTGALQKLLNPDAEPDDQVWGGVAAYPVHYTHSLSTRSSGLGDNAMGVMLTEKVVFSSLTYRFGTADGSGTTTVEIRKNGSAVSGTSSSRTSAEQTTPVTLNGSWAFEKGDLLTVFITAIGTTPGSGLVVDLRGSVS